MTEHPPAAPYLSLATLMAWTTSAGTPSATSPPRAGSPGARTRSRFWYAVRDSTLYLLSGGGARSDWVRNLTRNPEVGVRIGDRVLAGRARVVDDADEDRSARDLVYNKYQAGYRGDLTGWRDSALPIAIDPVNTE